MARVIIKAIVSLWFVKGILYYIMMLVFKQIHLRKVGIKSDL